MSRTFVLGDIHGAYRALRQCLERSSFDYKKDHLIFLGDVCDGWPETKLCVDELLKVKNLTYILGNHDTWTLGWMQTGAAENLWLDQGGRATVESYLQGIPDEHIQLLASAVPYHVRNNSLFVHAGIDPRTPVALQSPDTFLWDRDLARIALDLYTRLPEGKLTEYDEVYLGHTPIPYPHPVRSCEVWLMDTGAGWSGVLSMMNIDTKEIFISDPVPSLYPGIGGRKRVIR